MEPIKVVVTGASGKMAKEVLNALCRNPELEPVGAVSRKAAEDYLSLPDGSGLIPLSSDLEAILTRCQPNVVVDFTNASAVMPTVRLAANRGVHLVVGTTGIPQADLEEIDKVAHQNDVGAVVAPNFALGAVLMIHLAKIAARHFEYVDITEMHHEQKADAPSGTALTTARELLKARGKPFKYAATSKETHPGTRGGELDGVSIHAVRMPGFVAHQQVVFGSLGQTLTIRHDTVSRESFMPGVVLAIKEVSSIKGLVFGLDALLGL